MIITGSRSLTRFLIAGGLVLALTMSMVGLASAAEAKTIHRAFFGMHDSRVSQGVLTDAPIGSVRIWDAGTSWREIETRNGSFDFRRLDLAVTTALQRGVRPMVVLGQTPRSHATRPHAPGSFGRGASSMPFIRPWKRYVAKVAKEFGTSVDYQVWNEPNVVNYWTGSISQMVTLTTTASRTIKRVAGPTATVVAPSFPLRLTQQQRWFRAYWHAKIRGKSVADSIDVVSANLYPSADQGPEESIALVRLAKQLMPQAARRKPFWNTEVNYGLLGGATARRIPSWKQAAFAARTLILNAASPVRRVYWYSWGIGSIANTHLAKSDGTRPTRAGQAWELTEQWLVGREASGCGQRSAGSPEGVYTCVFRKGRGDVRRIYWKPRGKAVFIKTASTTVSWTDLSGATTARAGRFRLAVGQVPVLVTSRS